MTEELQKKYLALREYLASLGNIAVAFSSGVDSTLLLQVAHDVLGDKAIAVTAVSGSFPKREFHEASAYCQENHIPHYICSIHEMDIPGFPENTPDRCYLCKRKIFETIQATALAQGISVIAEGSNMDDNGDYRPGMIAIRELGVKSPLRHCQLYKSEIRQLSKMLGLPTWSKPAFACLASRFPYGQPITSEKLAMVDKAEQLLWDLGFEQFRVRVHQDMARLEILPGDFPRLMEEQTRTRVYDYLKSLGFTYVSLDLGGYRTGSMNEVLPDDILKKGIWGNVAE